MERHEFMAECIGCLPHMSLEFVDLLRNESDADKQRHLFFDYMSTLDRKQQEEVEIAMLNSIAHTNAWIGRN